MRLVGRMDNDTIFTPSSYVHLAFGILCATFVKSRKYPFDKSLLIFSLFHLVYEIKDQVFGISSFVNSIGDQAIAMLGFCIPFFTDMNTIPLAVAAMLLYFSPLSSKTGKGGWAFPHTGWNDRD